MCNANNHPPFCECGWGGGNNTTGTRGGNNTTGTRGATRSGTTRRSAGIYIGRKLVEVSCNQSQGGNLTYYQYSGRDFCKKSRCQYCGSDVYFIKHNDGCAFFDELGYPWPKHDCIGMSQNRPKINFFSNKESHNIFLKKDKIGKVIKIYRDRMLMQYLIQIANKQLIFVETKIKDAVFHHDDLVIVRIKEGIIHLIKKGGLNAVAKNVEQRNIGTPVRSPAQRKRDEDIEKEIKLDHTYEGFVYDADSRNAIVRLYYLDAEVGIKNLAFNHIQKHYIENRLDKVYVKVKITHKSSDYFGVHLRGNVVEFL